MPENKVNTSAGSETASETVARIKQQLAESKASEVPADAPNQSGSTSLVDAITARLTQQSTGIATSASSRLQSSIEQAIRDTQRSGNLSSQALQIERQREVGFAQDRASANITGALEERTGYATQVVALRELTETTEKSIRDLDQRYQQAILMNDAETAKQVGQMRLEKEKFLMEQEQNFYQNMMQAAGLEMQQYSINQQNEQFVARQEQEQEQFMQNLQQSESQFTRNLALQYQEFGLQERELELAAERNQISREELQLRREELNKSKNTMATKAMLTERMARLKMAGYDVNNMDAADLATTLLTGQDPDGNSIGQPIIWEGDVEEVYSMVIEARTSDAVANTQYVPPAPPRPALGTQIGRGIADVMRNVWNSDAIQRQWDYARGDR